MINHFSFKQFSDSHLLLTNDFGAYSFVTRKELKSLLENTLPQDGALYSELCENGFILPYSSQELADMVSTRYRNAKNYLFGVTSLHIFVLTTACNLNCIYCQARDHEDDPHSKMDIATAQRAVDIALQSPEKVLSFEFQGGEPTLNFETLRFIVTYAEQHKGHHELLFSVVTNLIHCTEEMMDFFKAHHIHVSTSLDGHAMLHDLNRSTRAKQGTHSIVCNCVKTLQQREIPVGAIQTTTRHSLPYAKEIVDSYRDLGFNSIFVRPLTKLGTAVGNWEEIGYEADEFVRFYEECLQYIIDLNKQGISFTEGHASLFLSKILHGKAQNYMELRSPCGAAVGQVAYFCNGDVYTCDEGRMLASMGDTAFKLGNVFTHTYDEMMASPVCKTVCLSSTLEGLPECADCVYHPYCGTCPVLNYAADRNIFKRQAQDYRCRIYKGMLDTIFKILYRNDPEEIAIISKW